MIGCRLNRSHTASGLAIGPPSSVVIIVPMRCSDAPSVQPELKVWLLRSWHRLWAIVHWLHRCTFLHHRFNWCLKADLAWFHSVLRNEPTWRRRFIRLLSDAPMVMHRLNRCHCFLLNLSNASQRSIGSFKFILSLDFYYILTPLRMIGLVILMVDWTWRLDDRLNIASWRWIRRVESYPWDLKILQVWSHKLINKLIMLSLNHQNHKQWPKWGHVPYKCSCFSFMHLESPPWGA